jgi:hypothetical protein
VIHKELSSQRRLHKKAIKFARLNLPFGQNRKLFPSVMLDTYELVNLRIPSKTMKHLQTPQTMINSTLVLCISVHLITCYIDQPYCQQVTVLNAPDSNRSLHPPAPNMPTRSKGAKMHRKEEEAMALATLAREKEAAKRQLQEEEAAVPAASGVALPSVVSPPSASNLNSLLTGHVGQESERAQEDGIASKAMEADLANNTGKPPKKKESKKYKISKEGKKDNANKRDQHGLAIKKGSFTTVTPAITTPPANKYKYERVFYEAGLELKGEDKYGAYVKQIGNLLDNSTR